jgi:RNA polymerase sigma-70 factor (ECF subfamily)
LSPLRICNYRLAAEIALLLGISDKDQSLATRLNVSAPRQNIDQLIVAAGAGDQRSFSTLYDETSGKIFAVILRMVRSRAEAEDILQDVYLRVWSNAAQYEPGRVAPWTWMITIARNRTIDILRAGKPRKTQINADISEFADILPSEIGEEEEIMKRDSLRRCLDTLDGATRKLLVEAYLDGWSREELASAYGAPVNTIKTRLHRGLAALKLCLGDA